MAAAACSIAARDTPHSPLECMLTPRPNAPHAAAEVTAARIPPKKCGSTRTTSTDCIATAVARWSSLVT
ncbi:MAG TPA: hypothetical protein VMC83_02310 [Streptosporangiaceae bacterium]|nr:hypothetical protein [Streptosporangiaceae bacterium]